MSDALTVSVAPTVPQCYFGDPRLDRRTAQLFAALAETPHASLKQVATCRAEQVAYGRLLRNPNVTVDALTEGIVADTHQRLRTGDHPHLLIISDTSEINLQAHRGYHQGRELGVAGNNTDAGFFIHHSLALEPH